MLRSKSFTPSVCSNSEIVLTRQDKDNSQRFRRASHAAGLRDRERNVKVAQFDAPTDADPSTFICDT